MPLDENTNVAVENVDTPVNPEVSAEQPETPNEVGTLPNTTKEQFVSYVEDLKVKHPEEYERKKDYLDKVLLAYN